MIRPADKSRKSSFFHVPMVGLNVSRLSWLSACLGLLRLLPHDKYNIGLVIKDSFVIKGNDWRIRVRKWLLFFSFPFLHLLSPVKAPTVNQELWMRLTMVPGLTQVMMVSQQTHQSIVKTAAGCWEADRENNEISSDLFSYGRIGANRSHSQIWLRGPKSKRAVL